jgi:hypothetical protein
MLYTHLRLCKSYIYYKDVSTHTKKQLRSMWVLPRKYNVQNLVIRGLDRSTSTYAEVNRTFVIRISVIWIYLQHLRVEMFDAGNKTKERHMY